MSEHYTDLENWFVETSKYDPRILANGIYNPSGIHTIKNFLSRLSHDSEKEFPVIACRIFKLKDDLFYNSGKINIITFWRIFDLLQILKEQKIMSMWQYIHPDIELVSKQKFLDGHYADAVESAFKEVNKRIKYIYQTFNPNDIKLDGAPLMQNVFSSTSPKLLLCEQKTESGQNIQKGYRMIFEGSMTAIRNQTAHDNIKMTPNISFQKIMLASLLMSRLDMAETCHNQK